MITNMPSIFMGPTAAQAEWKGALFDLVDGHTDGPVRIPASVMRKWLAARGSDAVLDEDWTAKRDPCWPGLAECNGVRGLGGGWSMRWDDLRRIAEAA